MEMAMEDLHCSHDLLLLSMARAAVIVNRRSPLFPTNPLQSTQRISKAARGFWNVLDSDLTRQFITRYHLGLLALQAHGADKVNVDRRIGDELQRRLLIAGERSF
ncbi:hypothetical protein ACB092_05G074300 [Castanea dentata]